MVNGKVQFLDEVNFGGRGDNGDVGEGENFTAVASGKGKGFGFERAGSGEGVENVASVARSGDADYDVSRAGQAEDELGVAVFVVAIVGKGGTGGGKAGERNDRERTLELAGEIGAEPGLKIGA